MNQLNINTEFSELALKAAQLAETGRYDVDMLISAWRHQLNENNFFYDYLVDKAPEQKPEKAVYHLEAEPQVHQLVYVQIGRGYATELRDPHWCYVVKNSGTKLMVIPLTSIKEDSGPARVPFELDIVEEDGTVGRMRLDDMRSVDKMRIIQKKGYRGVQTSEEKIKAAMRDYLSL